MTTKKKPTSVKKPAPKKVVAKVKVSAKLVAKKVAATVPWNLGKPRHQV